MEVLGVDDLKLLVETGSVDWGSTAEGEDLPLVWALKNKEEVVEILAGVNTVNLEGASSFDLAIICGEKTLRVHKWFMKARSMVIEASLRSGMTEERLGVVRITDISHETITAMIHFF